MLAILKKPIRPSQFKEILDKIQAPYGENSQDAEQKYQYFYDDIKEAIENREFVPFFQPKIDLQTNELCAAEVLVRWKHPEHGLVLPGQFIETAEKTGLINAITYEVLDLTFQEMSLWAKKGIKLPVSINLCIADVKKLSLPYKLNGICNRYNVSPDLVTVELKESAVMGELISSLDVLNRIRTKGFSLSIDDFGTGYSSLSHLYKAPFTELKIDRHFVRHILDDKEAMAIIKICIMLGSMLKMIVVAEGVESDEVKQALTQLGCHTAQGFYFSAPLPSREMVAFYEQNKSY